MKITLNVSSAMLAKLKELAHKESLKTGLELGYTDLIRRAIEERHPEIKKLPDQVPATVKSRKPV